PSGRRLGESLDGGAFRRQHRSTCPDVRAARRLGARSPTRGDIGRRLNRAPIFDALMPGGASEQPAATILVVDDDALNRAFARDHLEDAGYRVACFDMGEKALAF